MALGYSSGTDRTSGALPLLLLGPLVDPIFPIIADSMVYLSIGYLSLLLQGVMARRSALRRLTAFKWGGVHPILRFKRVRFPSRTERDQASGDSTIVYLICASVPLQGISKFVSPLSVLTDMFSRVPIVSASTVFLSQVVLWATDPFSIKAEFFFSQVVC